MADLPVVAPVVSVVPPPDPGLKKYEIAMEFARLAFLGLLAVAFGHFGHAELASAALGGALALIRPRNAPGPGALTLGLAFGAAALAVPGLV